MVSVEVPRFKGADQLSVGPGLLRSEGRARQSLQSAVLAREAPSARLPTPSGGGKEELLIWFEMVAAHSTSQKLRPTGY